MIPREYFLYPSGYDQIANEQPDKYSIDIKRSVKEGWMKQEPTEDGQGSIISLIPKNGIFLAVTGADFPLKCYPDASAVFATNLVKAMIIETLKLVGKWYLLPFLLLINKQKALDAFNRVALKAVSPTLLKDECLTNFSRETKRFIEVFVSKLGLTGGDQLAIIVSNLIDYDNAYRLRLEDVLSETSKYRLLKNPRKEIRRLVGILKERETLRCEIKNTNIHYKFKVTAWLFSLALLIPKFNRAFKEAIEQSNFENFQYDEIDMYWVSMRTDFLWLGLTNEERLEFANKKGWKFPKPITLA